MATGMSPRLEPTGSDLAPRVCVSRPIYTTMVRGSSSRKSVAVNGLGREDGARCLPSCSTGMIEPAHGKFGVRRFLETVNSRLSRSAAHFSLQRIGQLHLSFSYVKSTASKCSPGLKTRLSSLAMGTAEQCDSTLQPSPIG